MLQKVKKLLDTLHLWSDGIREAFLINLFILDRSPRNGITLCNEKLSLKTKDAYLALRVKQRARVHVFIV